MNNYASLNYATPDMFEGRHKGAKTLIIGTGHSTKNLVQYKDRLKEKFDVVIGLNFSTKDFEDQLDFHMILEKNPVKSYESMKTEKYRLNLPRILNWKSLDKFPDDILAVKATRDNFGGAPDIRKYKYNGTEGLLIGPQGNKNLSVGSVALNGIHFAGIIGSAETYLVGADLMFKDQFDHYYPDNLYRKSKTKEANRSPIITVKHDGKEYKTTKFFEESAAYIDKVIETLCRPAGMEVYDFSDGLITKAKKLRLEEFMEI